MPGPIPLHELSDEDFAARDGHLDNSVLAALQDVMDEDYPVLLDTFISDSEERLRALDTALLNHDIEGLGVAAHSFKGSSSNMGAPHLAGLCRELEDGARRQQLGAADAATLVAQIVAEFTIVRRLFNAERRRFF